MNRCYRTVWNSALGACVAVAENATAPRGGARGSKRTVGASAVLAVAALAASGVAQAGTFAASNEAELITAINQANASTDPSSTITFTGATVTGALPQLRGNVALTSTVFTSIQSAAGASLDLQAGATYQVIGTLMLGDTAGTTGTLTVQGNGSKVSANTLQTLAGQSNIRVLDGATLSTGGASGVRLGGTPTVSNGGAANALVNGAGSKFSVGVTYTQHRGTLEVSDGASLRARAGINLGTTAGGFTGLVTGAGSTLSTEIGAIALGASGSATVSVADGAVISPGDGSRALNLATNAGGSATLNIGAAEGQAAVAPGTVVASAVNGGAGTAVLNFNHNASAYDFASPITGNITVNQVGSGTTTLSGTSTYTGATNVAAGTLAVNGSLANSSVNVLAAGRLQGTGSVAGASVAGTIAPGNSIGTFTVNGNFTQSSGSTYQAEVDPASTASDLLHVVGTASVASGSQLQVVRAGNANFGVGNRYTVLSADGGLTGTYSLTGDVQSAFVRLVDSYDANHVYLTAEKTRSIADAGGTGNQAAVGGAIDSLPADNGLATAVTWLPTDFAARDALNQLSADIHASTKTATLEDSRFVREAAIDRLRSAACAPGSASPAPQAPGCKPEGNSAVAAWAHAFGSWGHIDSDGNASKLKRDIGGIVVGADTSVGAGWRVGAMGGYSHASADTSARNSSSKTDSYHLGAYGGTQWGATSLRLGLSQSWNKLDTSRSVAFQGFAGNLSGDYDSTTTQAFADIGHRIDLGRAALEPFAGLAHVRLHSDAFYEDGGPAALYSYGGSTDATFSSLGVRASTQAGDNLRLRGMLAWRHAFGDTTPSTTHAFGGSLPFTLSGVPLAKNVAAVEAGVETQLRKNLTLSASYSGQFGDGLQDHGAKVELNWAF